MLLLDLYLIDSIIVQMYYRSEDKRIQTPISPPPPDFIILQSRLAIEKTLVVVPPQKKKKKMFSLQLERSLD